MKAVSNLLSQHSFRKARLTSEKEILKKLKEKRERDSYYLALVIDFSGCQFCLVPFHNSAPFFLSNRTLQWIRSYILPHKAICFTSQAWWSHGLASNWSERACAPHLVRHWYRKGSLMGGLWKRSLHLSHEAIAYSAGRCHGWNETDFLWLLGGLT